MLNESHPAKQQPSREHHQKQQQHHGQGFSRSADKEELSRARSRTPLSACRFYQARWSLGGGLSRAAGKPISLPVSESPGAYTALENLGLSVASFKGSPDDHAAQARIFEETVAALEIAGVQMLPSNDDEGSAQGAKAPSAPDEIVASTLMVAQDSLHFVTRGRELRSLYLNDRRLATQRVLLAARPAIDAQSLAHLALADAAASPARRSSGSSDPQSPTSPQSFTSPLSPPPLSASPQLFSLSEQESPITETSLPEKHTIIDSSFPVTDSTSPALPLSLKVTEENEEAPTLATNLNSSHGSRSESAAAEGRADAASPAPGPNTPPSPGSTASLSQDGLPPAHTGRKGRPSPLKLEQGSSFASSELSEMERLEARSDSGAVSLFRCQFPDCEAHFESRESWKAHILAHAAESPTRVRWNDISAAVLCKSCGAAFQSPEAFKSHMCSAHSAIDTRLFSPMSQHHKDVEIYWDSENISLPRDLSPFFVVVGMNKYLQAKGVMQSKTSRTAIHLFYRPFSPINEKVMQKLDKANVDLICVPGKKPEAVDLKLQNSIHHALDTKEPSATTIVLISSDYDFLSVLRAAYQRGFRVILIYQHLPPEQFSGYSSCTHAMYLWRDIIDYVQKQDFPAESDPPVESATLQEHHQASSQLQEPLSSAAASAVAAATAVANQPPLHHDGKRVSFKGGETKKPLEGVKKPIEAKKGRPGAVKSPAGARAVAHIVKPKKKAASNANTPAQIPPPLLPPAPPAKQSEQTSCWHFLTKGSCRYAADCKFLHESLPREIPLELSAAPAPANASQSAEPPAEAEGSLGSAAASAATAQEPSGVASQSVEPVPHWAVQVMSESDLQQQEASAPEEREHDDIPLLREATSSQEIPDEVIVYRSKKEV